MKTDQNLPRETAQNSADQTPVEKSGSLKTLLKFSPLVIALTACGGGNGNALPDFTAPKVDLLTDITNPAAPKVITANPDGSYNLEFFANQTETFEFKMSKQLWNPTTNLYPLTLDANGNPTGVPSRNPTAGMFVDCLTNNPANATTVTCTVTTDATFNMGTATAKMIPLKFCYSGSVYGANMGTTTVNDTVSAVAPTLPTLPATLAPIATGDIGGLAPMTITINAPVLLDANGVQIPYTASGLPTVDANGINPNWVASQTGNTVNITGTYRSSGVIGTITRIPLTITSSKATGSIAQPVDVTAN
jgi:hypothetical protein